MSCIPTVLGVRMASVCVECRRHPWQRLASNGVVWCHLLSMLMGCEGAIDGDWQQTNSVMPR